MANNHILLPRKSKSTMNKKDGRLIKYYENSNFESIINVYFLVSSKVFQYSHINPFNKYLKYEILILVLFSIMDQINSHVCGFDKYPHKKPEVLEISSFVLEEADNGSNPINDETLQNYTLNRINHNDEGYSSFDSGLKFLDENPSKENNEIKNKRLLQSTTFQSIRIYFDYTTLDSQTSSYDASLISGVKQVLTNTQGVFQNLIMVKRYTTNLRITKYCDSNISMGTAVKNGVDTDLVIFPFFDSTLSSTSTEAYASACIISPVDKRPVAGLIGFSPKFNPSKPNWDTYYTNLALHELTHVLVFNPNLFEYFRDANGNSYNTADVQKTQVINGLERNLLAYPKTLAAAKNHFNCSSLLGVELENQGGSGTAASHWESRVMLGDYMIGLSFDDTAISDITLALFEDSGWYQIKYYTGGLFKFGKNKGCDFVTKKCIQNGVAISNDEFCTTPYQSLCVSNKLTRGICYITDSSDPSDDNYKYFSKATTGGLFMSDYCPVIAVPTNTTYFYPWSCAYGLSTYPAEFDEIISDNSACFMSNAVRTIGSTSKYSQSVRATCYKYSCDFTNFVLTINLGTETLTCPKEGGVVKPSSNYQGSVVCPDFYKICTSTPSCRDMVQCALNKISSVSQTVNYTPVNTVIANANSATTNANVSQPTNTSTTPTAVSAPTSTTNTPSTSPSTGTTSSPPIVTTNNTVVISPTTTPVPTGNTIVPTTKPTSPAFNKTLTTENTSLSVKVSVLNIAFYLLLVLNFFN